MRSCGRTVVALWVLLHLSGSRAERSTGDDDDANDRRGRAPAWHSPSPSGGRLMGLLDGKAGQDLQREMAECEYTKQRSRRLETQISKLFQTIHNRSAELAEAKSELEVLHAGYAEQLNAKEGAWQSALDISRAQAAQAVEAASEAAEVSAVSDSSCKGAEEAHKEALEALRSHFEDQLSAKEEAWGFALERADAQLRAHAASGSGSSGSRSRSLGGASDDRVGAAELAAMREDYEAQLAAKEAAWAAAHAEVSGRLAQLAAHPAKGHGDSGLRGRRKLAAAAAAPGGGERGGTVARRVLRRRE